MEQEQQGEIKMDLEALIPTNLTGTIKDNYIKGLNLLWKCHTVSGRFILFTLPIVVLELIILAVLKHYTGVEIGAIGW